MYLAVIGNIRGNLPALQAVLREIDLRGIHTIFNTGNCAVGKDWVNECMDVLRARRIESVQGEEDRMLVRFFRKRETLSHRMPDQAYETLSRASRIMTSENLEFLRGLPKSRSVQREGINMLLFHGTPTSQADTLDPDADDERLRRIRETANAQLLIFNGGPTGFSRWIDDTLFAGTGRVDGAGRAGYTIIDTETRPWRVEFCEAVY